MKIIPEYRVTTTITKWCDINTFSILVRAENRLLQITLHSKWSYSIEYIFLNAQGVS